MKKLILLIAAVAISFSAKAQLWAGGGIGFGVIANIDGPSTVEFFVAPEVGYSLTNKLDVALEFDYGLIHANKATSHTVQVGPYVRYTPFQWGRVSLFGEAAIHYLYSSAGALGRSGCNIQLRPGLLFDITDKWSLNAKFTLLEYQYRGGSALGFRLTTGLSVGFAYKFS